MLFLIPVIIVIVSVILLAFSCKCRPNLMYFSDGQTQTNITHPVDAPDKQLQWQSEIAAK